ncbi:MAG: hypothetical protein ACRD0K_30945 [Egibacteraceae bacterium]
MGLGVLIGIAGLATPFLLVRLQRGWSWRDAAASDQRRGARDREIMLKRVRHRWITGVLEHSLADEARIRLGLTRRPDALQRPGMTIRRAGQPPEPLPAGVPVSAVFAEAGGGAAHPGRARVGQDHRTPGADPRPARPGRGR